MTKKQNYLYVALLALAAGITLSAMLTAMITTGANTRMFENIMSVSQYQSLLLTYGSGLRIVMGFDNIYLILVAALFLFLTQLLMTEKNRIIIYAAIIPILITTYLDLVENHHIMSLLVLTVKGLPISLFDLQGQYIISLIKFHGGQLNYFLLAFFLPQDTILEKVLKYGLLFVMMPITVFRFAFTDQNPSDITFVFGFVAGLFLAAYVFWNRYQKEKN